MTIHHCIDFSSRISPSLPQVLLFLLLFNKHLTPFSFLLLLSPIPSFYHVCDTQDIITDGNKVDMRKERAEHLTTGIKYSAVVFVRLLLTEFHEKFMSVYERT
jgi:flagellar basal body rod protein FlgB